MIFDGSVPLYFYILFLAHRLRPSRSSKMNSFDALSVEVGKFLSFHCCCLSVCEGPFSVGAAINNNQLLPIF